MALLRFRGRLVGFVGVFAVAFEHVLILALRLILVRLGHLRFVY